MDKGFLFVLAASVLSPSLANANDLPTVEVNLNALNHINQALDTTGFIQEDQSFEIAMRPPAPRSEAPIGYPAPPVYQRSVDQAPAPTESAIENPFGIDGEFSANVGVASEYVFRGVAQTREAPAIQGGFDYGHPSGAYVGIWASSIDFGVNDAGTAEFDYYAGYSHEIGNGLTADGGFIYYNYPGAKENLNYDFVEGYVGLEYATNVAGHDVTTNATLNYSPDYFAASGQSYYMKLAASAPVTDKITVDGHIARQLIEDNAAFALPDYNDWSLGVAYAMEGGYEAKLQYLGTDVDEDECADGCDSKGVLSLSKSL